MTVPLAADELRVDYYAGVIAILAIIIFAKFMAHRGKSDGAAEASRTAHLFCVSLAGIGAIVCLGVLGWANPNSVEVVARVLVAVLTLIAAAILLHDVTFGRGRKAQTRWPPCPPSNWSSECKSGPAKEPPPRGRF
jgi:hypothetical protein